MSFNLSRRAFLGSAASTLATLALPLPAFATDVARGLIVGKRTIEVNGKPASVFGIANSRDEQGLFLPPGQPFSVMLDNRSGEDTSIHWHGQVPPPDLDGVAETGYVPLLGAGQTRKFNFPARSGTHWMHSHEGLQEQRLMAAPLIVYTPEDMTADVQEATVILHDFTFRDPEEILEELTGSSGAGHGGMDHGSMSMDAMGGGMSSMASMEMDLNDVEYDAFLANDRTLDDPFVVRTEGGGRVRLRIINGATATAFWLDLGAAKATVLAVDGNPVEPLTATRFPLAQAQRIDLLIDVPRGEVVPVFAQREGDRARTGVVLASPGATIPRYASLAEDKVGPVDLSLEQSLIASEPLIRREADIRHAVMLTGSMSPYRWTLDERTWAERRPLEVKEGQRVELEFMNHSMMAHPMHLHGHHFQVVEIGGKKVSGAVRDTVMVPSMGTVVVAFDADNPGRWLFHCHNLYHMATGMMSELVYKA